jgi:hypothetical protein
MSRPSPRRVAAATGFTLAAAAAGLVITAPAAPAATITNPTAPTVSPSTVALDQPFTVSGSGCTADHGGLAPSVVISSPDTELLDGTMVKSDGTWVLKETLHGVAPGTYRLQVVCDDYKGEKAYPVVTVTLPGPGGTTAAPTTAPASTATVTTKNGVTTVTAAPGQSLTPTRAAAPGQKFQLNLVGFRGGEVTTWTLHSTPRALGTHTADASGTLVTPLTIPTGVAAGSHELWVTRADGTVVKYPVQVGDPELAYTGADVAVPLTLGLSLLGVGGAMVVATRRRNAAAGQA